MKNKEEPSSGLSRGNHRTPGDPSLPDSGCMRTTGSTVRPDDAAIASQLKLFAHASGTCWQRTSREDRLSGTVGVVKVLGTWPRRLRVALV